MVNCRYCSAPLGAPRKGFAPAAAACSDCGLLWLLEPPPAPRPRPVAGAAEDPRNPSRGGDQEARWALRRAGLGRGAKALDVGCSDGPWLATLERAGLEAGGLDPDQTSVSRACGAGLKAYAGTFDRAGLPADVASARPYDLIGFRESIYYMNDLKETFTLVRELLKPGGWLYIKCALCDSSYYDAHTDLTTRYGGAVQAMPTLASLEKVLAREGFRIAGWRFMEWRWMDGWGASLPARALRRAVGAALAKSIASRADRVVLIAQLNTENP